MNQTDASVLITGCSSGIGLHCARTLKRRGWRVIATARQERDVRRLRSEGFESTLLDLSKSASIQTAVAFTLEATAGRLDALFSNGAYGQPGAVEDLSREALRLQFEVNVIGTFDLINQVIPVMRRQGGGRIVQNSSVLGLVAMPFRGAYNGSKFALEGLTDTLRQELHGSGISVSLIEPGPIESRFRANSFTVFKAHIDMDRSAHQAAYRTMVERLQKEGAAVPFTLPPDAVATKLIHALEHPRPRVRYFVTFPTTLFAILRWLLPARMLDRIVRRL